MEDDGSCYSSRRDVADVDRDVLFVELAPLDFGFVFHIEFIFVLLVLEVLFQFFKARGVG